MDGNLNDFACRCFIDLRLRLALATSANIGSALTNVGNFQNDLISTTSGLGLGTFVRFMMPPVAVSMVLNIVMLIYWPDHANELRASPQAADPAALAKPFQGVRTSSGLSVHRVLQDSLNVSRSNSPSLQLLAEPEPEPEPEPEANPELEPQAQTEPLNGIGLIQGAARLVPRRNRAAGEGAVELKDVFTERFLQEKIGIQ